METPKVKVKYNGKNPHRWQHGNLSEDFKPGETKEVDANVAEILLGSSRIQRKFSKKKLVSEERISLFEEVTSEEIQTSSTLPTEKKKKVKKQVQSPPPIIPVEEPKTQTSEADGTNDADDSTQGEA